MINHLDILPDEIIILILNKCESDDIISFSLTCKRFICLCNDEILWRTKLYNDFAEYYLYSYPPDLAFKEIYLYIKIKYMSKIIMIYRYHDPCIAMGPVSIQDIYILPSGKYLEYDSFSSSYSMGSNLDDYGYYFKSNVDRIRIGDLIKNISYNCNDKNNSPYWNKINTCQFSMYNKDKLNKISQFIDVMIEDGYQYDNQRAEKGINMVAVSLEKTLDIINQATDIMDYRRYTYKDKEEAESMFRYMSIMYPPKSYEIIKDIRDEIIGILERLPH